MEQKRHGKRQIIAGSFWNASTTYSVLAGQMVGIRQIAHSSVSLPEQEPKYVDSNPQVAAAGAAWGPSRPGPNLPVSQAGLGGLMSLVTLLASGPLHSLFPPLSSPGHAHDSLLSWSNHNRLSASTCARHQQRCCRCYSSSRLDGASTCATLLWHEP